MATIEKKPTNASLWVIGLIVLMLGSGISVFSLFFVPDFLRRHMQAELATGGGTLAKAQVIAMADTGRRYSSSPVIHFILKVLPPEGTTFQIELDQEVPIVQMWQLHSGSSVTIRYNPAKHEQSVILAQ